MASREWSPADEWRAAVEHQDKQHWEQQQVDSCFSHERVQIITNADGARSGGRFHPNDAHGNGRFVADVLDRDAFAIAERLKRAGHPVTVFEEEGGADITESVLKRGRNPNQLGAKAILTDRAGARLDEDFVQSTRYPGYVTYHPDYVPDRQAFELADRIKRAGHPVSVLDLSNGKDITDRLFQLAAKDFAPPAAGVQAVSKINTRDEVSDALGLGYRPVEESGALAAKRVKGYFQVEERFGKEGDWGDPSMVLGEAAAIRIHVGKPAAGGKFQFDSFESDYPVDRKALQAFAQKHQDLFGAEAKAYVDRHITDEHAVANARKESARVASEQAASRGSAGSKAGSRPSANEGGTRPSAPEYSSPAPTAPRSWREDFGADRPVAGDGFGNDAPSEAVQAKTRGGQAAGGRQPFRAADTDLVEIVRGGAKVEPATEFRARTMKPIPEEQLTTLDPKVVAEQADRWRATAQTLHQREKAKPEERSRYNIPGDHSAHIRSAQEKPEFNRARASLVAEAIGHDMAQLARVRAGDIGEQYVTITAPSGERQMGIIREAGSQVVRQGTWYSFDEKGAMRQWADFHNGQLDGRVRNLDAREQPTDQAEFKAGVRHGKAFIYNEEGRVAQVTHYLEGQVVDENAFRTRQQEERQAAIARKGVRIGR